jgi:two-component system invasion response regulator UvrY
MQIKVLVVDDHELVRVGMRRLLEDNPMIELIHESSSGEVALEMAVLTNYDLILMDINLPGMTGLEAAEQLLTLAPKSRVIMVTGRLEGSLIRQILNAGVRGYVSKGSSADEMEKCTRECTCDSGRSKNIDFRQRKLVFHTGSRWHIYIQC